jgi:hypothetical protein
LFPQNPKILVIDDKFEEIQDLLKVLSKNGTPYAYFDGDENSVPDDPFSGIRLVILDIDLGNRYIGQTHKNQASMLATYLLKLISTKTNPFFILFWTRHCEVINEVLRYLKIGELYVAGHIDLDKPTSDEMKTMTIQDFETKINNAVSNESLDFVINWENGIDKAVSLFTNEMSDVCKSDSEESKRDWKESVMSVLSKLACSYIGLDKLDGIDRKNKLLYATYVLNKSFSENLPTAIDVKADMDLPAESNLSLRTVADLNTKLFFNDILDPKKIENGKIFIDNNNIKLLNLLKTKVLINSLPSDCSTELVAIILTPSCDLAHTKFLKQNDGIELHRVLYGVKLTITNDDFESLFAYTQIVHSTQEKVKKLTIDDRKLKKKILQFLRPSKPEILYITQPFIDRQDKICIIVFHFGTITTKYLKSGDFSFSYMLKENLTFDLQTKLANHVNRLGNSMLEC